MSRNTRRRATQAQPNPCHDHRAMTPHRILLIGPAWVGDMVMAQSLCMALKARRPDCAIDVLAPAWTFPLLQRMPEVSEAIAMPLGHGQLGLRERRRLGHSLQGRYGHAIVLPRSWKSALVPWFAEIPRRTGWLGELRFGLLNDARRLDRSALPRTVQRFVALGLERGEPLPPDCPAPRLVPDVANAAAARRRLGLEGDGRPVLALCPGAEYGPAKRWPPGHFATVARWWHESREGVVWLFGSAKDGSAAAAIAAAAAGICVDLCGRTDLAEAVDLLAGASAVVSNDSGLMHVAAALDRPLVAVYGSSDPGFTPPLGERAQVLRLGLECSPCFQRECPLGHTRCLVDLGPERVIAALEAGA